MLAERTDRVFERGRAMEAAAVPAVDVADRAPTAVVAARDLTRRYGEGDTAVDALRGVSIDVTQGKLTAVMGPSGSGKSTLMHILAALDRPTSGEVWIAGTKLGALSDTEITKLRRKHIGFVFQFFNLLPMLTADENVRLPMTIAGRKPDPGWYDELMRDSVESFGQTTVMVTHDPQAAAIADRILFLADGLIVRDMPRAEPSTVIAAMDELAAH